MRKIAKILLIHHSGNIGGAGMSLYSISEMLSFRHEVKVYCPAIPSDMSNFLKEKNINIDNFDNVGTLSAYSGGPHTVQRTFWRGLVNIPRSREQLKRIIKEEKPDIVAVNSIVMSWAGSIIQEAGAKSICFVRETARRSPWNFGIKHFLNTSFDGVIFISEYDKVKFSSKAPTVGIVRDCIKISDYTIDINREQACTILGLDPRKFNILFVGGKSKLKGWPVISKAMEYLANENINLVVAGYTGEVNEVVSKNIRFIGVQSDMPIVYRACDVLVFPSTSPHQARPVFEAGMMRLPAIISDFKQTREHISHMENGLTFTPGSISELINTIKMIYENNQLCRHLGEANYTNAINYHEYEKNREILLELIEKVLNPILTIN